MGYFPGKQEAKTSPRSRHYKGGGGGGGSSGGVTIIRPETGPGSAESIYKHTSPAPGSDLDKQVKEAKGETAKAPASQFRDPRGAELKTRPFTPSEMQQSLALRQQASKSARGYAGAAWAAVQASPARARRAEREARIQDVTQRQQALREQKQAKIDITKKEAGISARIRGGYEMVKGPAERGARFGAKTVMSPIEFVGRGALDVSKALGKAEPYLKEKVGKYKPFEKIAEISQLTGVQYLPGPKEVTERAGYVTTGFAKEFEEHPFKQTATFGAFMLIPPGLSAGKYALATKGLAVPKSVTAVAKYGLPATYAGVKTYEVAKEPTVKGRWEQVGRAGAEVSAMYAGGQYGIKLAMPIEYKTVLVKQVRRLPKAKQEKFWKYYKEVKAVEAVETPPKELSLKGFKRIPARARPAIKGYLRQDRFIVKGSAAQRPWGVEKDYSQSDVDVADLFGQPRKAALGLRAALTKARVSRVSVPPKGTAVTIKGKKAVEFADYKKLYASFRQVTPFYKPVSSQIAKTPSGIKITRLAPQARRKLVGAMLPGERRPAEALKDIRDFNRIMNKAYDVAEQEAAKGLFFQKEKIKEIRMLRGRKGTLRLGKVRETPEVAPLPRFRPRAPIRARVTEYEYVEPRPGRPYTYPVPARPSPRGYVYPSPSVPAARVYPGLYKVRAPRVPITTYTTTYRPPLPPTAYAPPGAPSPPYAPPTVTPPYAPPVSPPYTPPVTPPYTPPVTPPVTPPYSPPFIPPIKPPTLPPVGPPRLGGKPGKARKRAHKFLIRPFKYQASLKAVMQGVKQPKSKRYEEFFSGLEVRPIPIK